METKINENQAYQNLHCMVKTLKKEGHSIKKIARLSNLPKQIVKRWVKETDKTKILSYPAVNKVLRSYSTPKDRVVKK